MLACLNFYYAFVQNSKIPHTKNHRLIIGKKFQAFISSNLISIAQQAANVTMILLNIKELTKQD